MSDVKVEKVAEKKIDLEKQVASIAFTVRKIKNKLEEQLGMDIDGDGRVGSGPFKKAIAFLLIAGMASVCFAENKTALAVWSDNAYVDSASGIHATTFYGNMEIGDAIVNNATVRTNVGVGGTLAVTGIVTLIKTPVLKDGLTVGTNLIVSGAITTATARVTGVATLTATPVLLDGLTVGTNASVGNDLTVTRNVVLSGKLTGDCSGASSVPLTVTKYTGAVTATNQLATPTGVITPQTMLFTNYVSPSLQYTDWITNAYGAVTSTWKSVTGVVWSANVITVATNATIVITPNVATNAAVLVYGGGLVVTNTRVSNP